MAGQPPNPANSNRHFTIPPPSTSSQASIPYTPSSSSIADDSDTDFDPTPVHSPGGPQYDDLPPSYDEAQHDARNGITPLDPNQLEAHRLTINEGPNEPEIWEYRVRGEQPDAANEHEQAPDYESHASNLATTVPVQHVSTSEDIPIGRVQSQTASSIATADTSSNLLTTALEFTRHEPDADVQHAPRLTRRIAIPQKRLSGPNGGSSRRKKRGDGRQREPIDEEPPPGYSAASNEALHTGSVSSEESVKFLRAYAKALHAHSIRPAEFTDFLDGLNAICKATNTTADDLLQGTSPTGASSSTVHDYLRGANEAFFAPRGLRVSFQSLSALLESLSIPIEGGQRAKVLVSVADRSITADRRAQALYPWIEALKTDVPSPSTDALLLREISERSRSQNHTRNLSNANTNNDDSSVKSKKHSVQEDYADPPHSIPEPADETSRGGSAGRGGHGGGAWSPFGTPGHGPFGAPGNGPFGAPGNGPFGRHGGGPFGLLGSGSRGRGGVGCRRPGPGSSANDWAAWGENIGKWGEEFGKRMGEWGEQVGKRAEVWGQDVGKMAAATGSGTQSRGGHAPAYSHIDDDLPPAYPEGPSVQETGVSRGDDKTDASSTAPGADKGKGKTKATHDDDDDDDASSISSDSSDSDSDSDSDDEKIPDTEAIFLARLHSIDEEADLAATKGKKSPEEINNERAFAVEKARIEKTAMNLKIEEKLSKRTAKRESKHKSHELKRQHRQRRRELRAAHDPHGKGKAKAKKSKEWKEAKKDYKDKKKELRKEDKAAKKEWKKAKKEMRNMSKEGPFVDCGQKDVINQMVWVVIEDLGP